MLTLRKFAKMIPSNPEPHVWFKIAVDMFQKYDITTPNRIAAFMAQTAHESRDFRSLEENLNYSVSALRRVFGRYFGPGKRNPHNYDRNPQKLANYVYMDKYRSRRGALGNIYEGDGWKFRGGGIKQLTGRSNYEKFGRDIGMTADEAADYVRTKEGAFESACWFWKQNNLERYADRDDIDSMSKRVNGGRIGLQDRRNRYLRAKRILNTEFSLRRGAKGNLVREIQTALQIVADGDFGPNTERAVKTWQSINNYTPNGILNREQLEKLTD